MVSAQNLFLELLLWKYRKNLFATAALTAAWFLAKEGIKRYTQVQASKSAGSQDFGHVRAHAWTKPKVYSEFPRQTWVPIEGTSSGGSVAGRGTRVRIE
jgi:hypothetical protein